MKALEQYLAKAATLVQALPYIQSFRDRIVVVKYGGSTMRSDGQRDTVLQDIVFMESVGMRPVIVHGGGKAIDQRLKEQGIESQRINGLRVTDEPTRDVALAVLGGLANKTLVASLLARGVPAVGLSGIDGGMLYGHRGSPVVVVVGLNVRFYGAWRHPVQPGRLVLPLPHQ